MSNRRIIESKRCENGICDATGMKRTVRDDIIVIVLKNDVIKHKANFSNVL
jgi:hypothetical protein